MEKSVRADRIVVRRLHVSGFRNFQNITLNFSDRHVVFTGHNGAGKTNLLEALSLLSPGRGLRRAAYADMIHTTSPSQGFSVHARLQSVIYDEANIGTGTDIGEGGRKVRINGSNAAAERLTDYSRISWLTPAMDGLFTGAAGDRRRFMDRLVLAVDPGHARRVIDYEKVMRSRNRLLTDSVDDDKLFLALETQLAELGTAIAAARLDVVRLLGDVIVKMSADTPFPQAQLHIDGVLENGLVEKSALDVEEAFLERLISQRSLDRAAGRTLDGPHRTDLQVFYAAKNMAASLCSTGEQKVLLTGMILSHARLTSEISGMTPILLLDEMAAHLDENRRAALFDILDDLGGQSFMTGTERSMFAALEQRADFLEISDGALFDE